MDPSQGPTQGPSQSPSQRPSQELLNVLLVRLGHLSFVSGESGLKLDTLNRINGVLIGDVAGGAGGGGGDGGDGGDGDGGDGGDGAGGDGGESVSPATPSSPPTPSSPLLHLLRVFILDWDRAVRACAFRSLRLWIAAGGDTQRLHALSIDLLAVTRLESSKSPVERVAILRFLSCWMELDTPTTRYFLHSFHQLIIGQITSEPSSPFLRALIELSLVVFERRPSLVEPGPLRELIKALFPHISEEDKIRFLKFTKTFGPSFGISESAVSPNVFAHLLETGVDVLANSIGPSTILSGVSSEWVEQLLSGRRSHAIFLMHAIGFAPVLAMTIKAKILSPTHTVIPMHSLLELTRLGRSFGGGNEWKYPAWVNEKFREMVAGVASVDVSAPQSSRSVDVSAPHIRAPVDHFTLPADLKLVLDEITSLASLVQFNAKCNQLALRKQKTPRLFQSVPLWLQVQDRLQKGRFTLQARRAVHGLFVHTFCHHASFAELDQLVL